MKIYGRPEDAVSLKEESGNRSLVNVSFARGNRQTGIEDSR